ncbi:MAG TPA: alpha/beta hydrolase-fold protein [Planctomycetota bacterium]|nr:alpha/beta hydrolase-fold protein [Planctomycetota bacterium]
MTVEILEFESRVLRGNPLGDPSLRRTPVYLPPSYPKGRYPVYFMLTGFTGFGELMIQRQAWSESLPERLDRLIHTKKMGEAIVVMPDCFTRLGGSQYLNSSATGRYEDHVVRELVPYIDARYRTNRRRAVLGKSSGGYGAMVLGMRHPDVFQALACHSGDMYFEYCYQSDFPKAIDQIRKHGGAAKFVKAWEKLPKRMAGHLHAAVNTIAMSACYSPRGKSFDLPFDLATGEIEPAVWRRWKSLDPIELLDTHARDLKKLRGVFIDCGSRDQFALHHGARIFAAKARRLGLRVQHEEFDDDHSSISYRYDRSFPILHRYLSGK